VDNSSSLASKRQKRSPKPTLLQAQQLGATLREKGWKDFNGAATTSGGDGDEACEVELYYRKKTSTSGLTENIGGKTGENLGHAEMSAICHFLLEICKGDVDTFQTYDLWLSCPAKPCCCNCAAVLGLLKIARHSPSTSKTKKRMGKTQWEMPSAVQELLAAITGQHVSCFGGWDDGKDLF
jgi:hypothetical protein